MPTAINGVSRELSLKFLELVCKNIFLCLNFFVLFTLKNVFDSGITTEFLSRASKMNQKVTNRQGKERILLVNWLVYVGQSLTGILQVAHC